MSNHSSLGPLVLIAVGLVFVVLLTLGFFQVMLVWPARAINRLYGKSPYDDFGGKVIALSFCTCPVCVFFLFWLFQLPRNDYWAIGVGWLLGIWAAAKLLDSGSKP